MSAARFLLLILICASPAILAWDGLIVQGLIAGAAAIALLLVAGAMRPGEIKFLTSTIRPLIGAAAIPAIWMLLQAIPIGIFPHPIWKSAEQALGHPVWASISVDRGASAVALGQYLTTIAIVLWSAAVAVDRQRAEEVLLSLSAAVTILALILLTHRLIFTDPPSSPMYTQLVDCTCIGIIVTGASCVRTFERYETRHTDRYRSVPTLFWTLAACAAGFLICGATLILYVPAQAQIAAGFGLFALAVSTIIRRFRIGLLGVIGLIAPALGVIVIALIVHPPQAGTRLPLVFAASSSHPAEIALNQRVLEGAPFVGTGAGTFVAVAPMYRDMDDPPASLTATTAAAELAIELGQPMLYLIVIGTISLALALLRAAQRRGRDAFYAAMGGSSLITLLLLAFVDNGLLGTATVVITAAVIGIALAQKRSRSVRQ